jgi:hypothetical protein
MNPTPHRCLPGFDTLSTRKDEMSHPTLLVERIAAPQFDACMLGMHGYRRATFPTRCFSSSRRSKLRDRCTGVNGLSFRAVLAFGLALDWPFAKIA